MCKVSIGSKYFVPFYSDNHSGTFVECEVVGPTNPNPKTKDYRVELRRLDTGTLRSFYMSDFESHIKRGLIVEKDNENDHLETFTYAFPVYGACYCLGTGVKIVGK
jgi:hypothetical protein